MIQMRRLLRLRLRFPFEDQHWGLRQCKGVKAYCTCLKIGA